MRRGGVDGEITLDAARGTKVFKTQGALVTLEITDHSLQSIESRACPRGQRDAGCQPP